MKNSWIDIEKACVKYKLDQAWVNNLVKLGTIQCQQISRNGVPIYQVLKKQLKLRIVDHGGEQNLLGINDHKKIRKIGKVILALENNLAGLNAKIEVLTNMNVRIEEIKKISTQMDHIKKMVKGAKESNPDSKPNNKLPRIGF